MSQMSRTWCLRLLVLQANGTSEVPLDIVEHLRLHVGVFERPEKAILSWMPKIPVKSKDLSLLRGQRPHLILPKVESHALPFPAQDHHQQELEVDAHTKAQNATKKRHERAKQPAPPKFSGLERR